MPGVPGLDELRSKLDCVVCCHVMFPPIRQCAEGHTICDRCCDVIMSGGADGRKCPSCRMQFRHPVPRARGLEDWAIQSNVEVQCDLPDCGARFGYASFGEHMQSCAGRTVVCPTSGCDWRGQPADLGKHLSDVDGHGFSVTQAPYVEGRLTRTQLTFVVPPPTETRQRPRRQLIEVSLPASPARASATTVTFCVAFWKPAGASQPYVAAIQQLRKASCIGAGGWGCELAVIRGKHAVLLAAPAADLDSCSDVWKRYPVERCTGAVLVVPAVVAEHLHEPAPHEEGTAQEEQGGERQQYKIAVQLWPEWDKGDGRGGELPRGLEEHFQESGDEADEGEWDGEEDSESEESDDEERDWG